MITKITSVLNKSSTFIYIDKIMMIRSNLPRSLFRTSIEMLYAARTTFVRILRHELTPRKDIFANYENNTLPLHPATEFDKSGSVNTA